MICDWCKADAVQNIPSRRCKHCGGAHWTCGTPACDRRLIAECRAFCSACGAERHYPAVGRTAGSPIHDPSAGAEAGPALQPGSRPHVTICTVELGLAVSSEVTQDLGFYAGAAEGFSLGGRLIVAAPRQVLCAPAVAVGPASVPAGRTPSSAVKANPALGLLCQAAGDEGRLSTPCVLPGGVLLLSSARRVFAVSSYTGETRAIGTASPASLPAGGSLIRPVLAPTRDDVTDFWILAAEDRTAGVPPVLRTDDRRDAGGTTELLRFSYRDGECLEIGGFACQSRQAAPAGISWIAGAAESHGSPSVWFVGQVRAPAGGDAHPTCAAFKLDESGQNLGPSQALSCAIPRLDPARLRLWIDPRDEWFWLSRGGSQGEDGALRVHDALRNRAQPVEWSAFADAQPESQPALSAANRAPIDGIWLRTGPRLWGWCGEELVHLTCQPKPEGWTSEELLPPHYGKGLSRECAGPLIPTRWGLATCVAVRGTVERPDAIDLIYFDFPT